MSQQDYEKIEDFTDKFKFSDGVPEKKFILKVEPAKYCWNCGEQIWDNCSRCQNCGASC